MKSMFLKYLGCVAAVLAGVAVVDRAAGAGLDRLLEAMPVSQDIGKGRFAINDVRTDVVIVGSSRASHHYIPSVMADSLGCSVYNVGRDGCFFSDNICVTNAILERYSPKMLLLEVSKDCLCESSKTTVEGMFPYYWKSPYIQSVIDQEVGWTARVQLASKLYAYNADAFRLIGYGVKGLMAGATEDPLNGYAPLEYVERRKAMELKEEEGSQKVVISDYRCGQLRELLERGAAKGVRMVLICSPRYIKGRETAGSRMIGMICNEAGAEYYDFSHEELFLEHPEWFSDAPHLNTIGAEVYTRMVVEKVGDGKRGDSISSSR